MKHGTVNVYCVQAAAQAQSPMGGSGRLVLMPGPCQMQASCGLLSKGGRLLLMQAF